MGGAMGSDVPSLLRHVLIFFSVTSFQFLVSMTSSSSEILSHRQLTVSKFEGFFLIGTKLENGVSLSVSKQPLTVSLEMHRLQVCVLWAPFSFFFSGHGWWWGGHAARLVRSVFPKQGLNPCLLQ